MPDQEKEKSAPVVAARSWNFPQKPRQPNPNLRNFFLANL